MDVGRTKQTPVTAFLVFSLSHSKKNAQQIMAKDQTVFRE
jgi:hypothetical protein